MKAKFLLPVLLALIAIYLSYFPSSSGQKTPTNPKPATSAWPSSNPLHHSCPDSNCVDCVERSFFAKLYSTNYNKKLRPRQAENSPTIVHLNALVYSITNIDGAANTWTMTIAFRQLWNDHRLSYSVEGCPNYKYLTLTTAEDVWRPSTFFAVEREATRHNIPEPNVLLRIFPNGDITYSQRITLKQSCKDLPDSTNGNIVCTFSPASYAYTADDVEMHWTPDQTIQINGTTAFSSRSEYRLGEIEVGEMERTTVTGKYRSIFANVNFVKK